MNLQVGVKLLIERDGKFLCVRRSADFKPGGSQEWDIPGGRIEPGEELIEALAREIDEEISMELKSEPRLISAQDIVDEDNNLHVVRLTYIGDVTGRIRLSSEHDASRWFTRTELLSVVHVDRYLRDVIKSLKS